MKNKDTSMPWTIIATTATLHRAVAMTMMLLFFLANMRTPQAEYILKVELNRYLSNTHTRVDGFCCETLDHIPCAMECDNSFLFCLQWSNQSTLDGGGSCPLGNYSTGNISRDDAVFPAGPGEFLDQGVSNPMLFKGASWPGSVRLYVQVDDVDPPDQMVMDSSSLVAQFDVQINISLGDNRTARVERSTPYRDRIFHGTFLFLTIELSCVEHFYGPDCAKFCQPNNDDERGHYSCDNSGNIICLEGFHNEAANCTECSLATGCSSVGGYCNDTHHCICRESYAGENCEIDLDPCGHIEPCVNGGSCINTSPNNYSCGCPPGFEGRNCSQETIECQPDTCKNGGTCEDLHLAFVCTCGPGFTGHDCSVEINECLSNPCRNGGICQDAVADYQCNCVNGFSGRNCDDNPAAVSFTAVIGGGAVGLFLLILIALVLLVVLICVARQLKREKAIAAAGDLEAREQRGRTVSAVNPIHDAEHEADWEDMESGEMDEKKFINPAYEGVLTGQFVFEETELQANGGYSRLSSRMGSTQRKPQHRHFVETSAAAAGTPHYSSLNLNSGSTATDSGDHRSAQDPKNHQYEDVEGEGEMKVRNDWRSRESSREHTTNGLYEDVYIGKPEPVRSDNDYTESCNYEEISGFKQLQVEIEAEEGRDSEFENQELDLTGEMQGKEWNGTQNYSDDLELNQGTDNRESLDSMLDSEVEGTSV